MGCSAQPIVAKRQARSGDTRRGADAGRVVFACELVSCAVRHDCRSGQTDRDGGRGRAGVAGARTPSRHKRKHAGCSSAPARFQRPCALAKIHICRPYGRIRPRRRTHARVAVRVGHISRVLARPPGAPRACSVEAVALGFPVVLAAEEARHERHALQHRPEEWEHVPEEIEQPKNLTGGGTGGGLRTVLEAELGRGRVARVAGAAVQGGGAPRLSSRLTSIRSPKNGQPIKTRNAPKLAGGGASNRVSMFESCGVARSGVIVRWW